MKARRAALGGIAALLLAALAGAGLLAAGPESARIAVLVSSDTGIYADALTGLQSVVESPHTEVTYLDTLDEDESARRAYFESVRNADLLVTIGSAATRTAIRYAGDQRIVFSMVNAARTLGVRSKPGACGVSMDVSLREFFKSLKDLSPGATRVYAFYSTDEGEYLAQEGDHLDLRYGLDFHRVRLSDRDALGSALADVRGKADAIYLVPDALYDSESFQVLSEFCKANGIVLMTSFSSLMQAGATFSVRPDYTRIGSMTGEMVRRVLSGQSCTESGAFVVFPEQTFFSVNESYARDSGLTIAPEILRRGQRTRLFLAAVNLMNEGKPRSALSAFRSILRDDPANAAARTYQDRLVERISGDKTRGIIETARRFVRENNFERALQSYRQVLDINPGHLEAQEGIRSVLLRLSNDAMIRAQAQTDPFQAARLYTQALKYKPDNAQAQEGLNRIRAQERAGLRTLLQQAIESYDQRKYDDAIVRLDNILLIDPANKEAQQYLNQSIRKRDALKKL